MIASSTTAKPKVLVFCRDYLIPDFKKTVNPLEGSYTLQFLTDGSFPGVADTKQRFYARLHTAPPLSGWTEDDENIAIARCRLLRGLPRTQAVKMLRSMGSVLAEELDQFDPAFVFAQMVDEYSSFLLSELARRRGIKYLGICYSYFPGRIQVTQFWDGSAYPCRDITDDEAQEALDLVSERTFRQDYHLKSSYSFRRHSSAVLKYKVKSLLFPILASIKRDPYNLHYSILPFVAERRSLLEFPRESDFHQDWATQIRRKTEANGKPVVYIPLGYFPECSIDYWVRDTTILDYENVILKLCATLSANFNILVKEHPHMAGARSRRFYAAIKAAPDILSIPPSELSHDACERADVVLIGGGSIGIESYVRGNAIASFCDSAYWYQPARASFLDLSNSSTWTPTLLQLIGEHRTPGDMEKLEFIRACLSTTVRQQARGQVWPIPDSNDLAFLFESARVGGKSGQI